MSYASLKKIDDTILVLIQSPIWFLVRDVPVGVIETISPIFLVETTIGEELEMKGLVESFILRDHILSLLPILFQIAYNCAPVCSNFRQVNPKKRYSTSNGNSPSELRLGFL